MSEVATNLCAHADVLSWFFNLELSNQISVIGIIVSIITSIISFALGVISLILSHCYKKQADEFADLQFMPDFYQYNLNYAECSRLDAAVKYNASQTAPIPQTYCAQDSPIYNLNISYLSVDGKSIGDIAQYKSLDIYPTCLLYTSQQGKTSFVRERQGTLLRSRKLEQRLPVRKVGPLAAPPSGKRPQRCV